MKEIILTNSEAELFQDCRRKWWLTHYRELGRPETVRYNSPQSIGNMYHAALEAYYGRHEDPVEFARGVYAELTVQAGEELDELNATIVLKSLQQEEDLVIIMLEGYMQWLEEEAADSELEVLGAEDHVKLELAPGIQLQGKIDAPARWRNAPEILLQLEHKTAGDLTSIPKTAQVNSQFLTYDLLTYLRAKLLGQGQRTDGVLVNIARKVKRTVRAKPPFFGRHEVRHNEHELRSHWMHLVGIGREIQRTYERLDAGEDPHFVAPPRPTKDCVWKCPFAGPCLSGMFDDGSDVEGYLAANYVHRDPLERYGVEEEKEGD